MKVGLIDIDSKIPNLALMKLSAWHKKQGNKVELTSPLFANQYDLICASKIFSYTEMPSLPTSSDVGGSGVDLETELTYDVEHIMPDYSLYLNTNYSIGFTTRGCIRKCKFCIVPKKEGEIRESSDIYEFWNPRHKKLILLDNNILALPERFTRICQQIRKEGIQVDFNQGLDHRLLTQIKLKILKELSHIEYRFAFDHINQEKSVRKAIDLLKENGINRCLWYVLVGFDSTINEDLYRLNLLRGLSQTVYVQRYNRNKNKIYIPIAKWANQHHIFRGYTWNQFINHPTQQRYRKLFNNFDLGVNSP